METFTELSIAPNAADWSACTLTNAASGEYKFVSETLRQHIGSTPTEPQCIVAKGDLLDDNCNSIRLSPLSDFSVKSEFVDGVNQCVLRVPPTMSREAAADLDNRLMASEALLRSKRVQVIEEYEAMVSRYKKQLDEEKALKAAALKRRDKLLKELWIKKSKYFELEAQRIVFEDVEKNCPKKINDIKELIKQQTSAHSRCLSSQVPQRNKKELLEDVKKALGYRDLSTSCLTSKLTYLHAYNSESEDPWQHYVSSGKAKGWAWGTNEDCSPKGF